MRRKSPSERQKECRERKKKEGRYISIFVPNTIYEKIKGRPRILIDYFLINEEFINTIVELEKKHIALKRQMTEFVKQAKIIEKELERIYKRTKIEPLYNILSSKDYWISAEEKLNHYKYYEGPWALLLYRREVLELQFNIKKYLEKLENNWYQWHYKINNLKDDLAKLLFDQKTGQYKEIERQVAIKELKNVYKICRQIYEEKLYYDLNIRREYASLLKKIDLIDKFEPKEHNENHSN
ncbi:MAG: hypothetical protein N2745_07325, partial [Syntrophorhabdaceae bacterium]|nr:hypothetical protein [Syntrophorhabdaceae bacterium]